MSKTYIMMTEEQALNKVLNLNLSNFDPTPDQKKFIVNPIIRATEKALNYGNDSKLYVIEAFTGSGKTTTLGKHTLNKMKKYANAAIFIAPSVDLTRSFAKIVGNKHFRPIILDSSKLDSFIDQDAYGKFPVFITTSQFLIQEKNFPRFEMLLETLAGIDPEKVGAVIFADEAHKGIGTSSDMTYGSNFGMHMIPGGYDAVTFNALKALNDTGHAITFCMTATPTNEQLGNLADVDELKNYEKHFEVISRYERCKTKSPFVNVHHDDIVLDLHKIKKPSQAHQYVRIILLQALKRFVYRIQKRLEMGIRQPHMMIRVARKPKGIDFLPIKAIYNELAKLIEATIKSHGYDWNNLVLARYTQEEAIIDHERVEKDTYVDAINAIFDRPVIQLVVDGLTVGTDFPFVSDIVTYGVPTQANPETIGNEEWITNNIEQFVGRGMRTGLPPYDVMIHDLAEMKLSDKTNDTIIDKITELVTLNVYFNDADMHHQLSEKITSETFSPTEGKQWLKDLLYGEQQVMGESNDKSDNSDSNVIRIRNKLVHDHTNFTKQFKKNWCEYHDDACFEVSFKTYLKKNPDFPMTRDTYRDDVWYAQLQVDHIDGNRENNDESNFMTTCGNGHLEKTLLHGDCYNNYTNRKLK